MKVISKLVFALVAAGFCVAASADTDSERRARNREEAIANHERMEHRDGMRQRDSMDDRHPGARQRVREGARSTRNFTHRQAEKMRRFSERQNQRHPGPVPGTTEPNKAPVAIGK